jgi:hypothetical protein
MWLTDWHLEQIAVSMRSFKIDYVWEENEDIGRIFPSRGNLSGSIVAKGQKYLIR